MQEFGPIPEQYSHNNERHILINLKEEELVGNKEYVEIMENSHRVRVLDNGSVYIQENVGDSALLNASASSETDLDDFSKTRTSVHVALPSGMVQLDDYSSLYTGNEFGRMIVSLWGDKGTIFTHKPKQLEIIDANKNPLNAESRVFVLPDISLDPEKIFDNNQDTILRNLGNNSIVYKENGQELLILKVRSQDGSSDGLAFFARKRRLSQSESDKLVFIGGGKLDQHGEIIKSIRTKLGRDEEDGLPSLEERIISRFDESLRDQQYDDKEKQQKFYDELHTKSNLTIEEAMDIALGKRVETSESSDIDKDDFNNANEEYLKQFYAEKRNNPEYGSVILTPSGIKEDVKPEADDPALQNILDVLNKKIRVTTN